MGFKFDGMDFGVEVSESLCGRAWPCIGGEVGIFMICYKQIGSTHIFSCLANKEIASLDIDIIGHNHSAR